MIKRVLYDLNIWDIAHFIDIPNRNNVYDYSISGCTVQLGNGGNCLKNRGTALYFNGTTNYFRVSRTDVDWYDFTGKQRTFEVWINPDEPIDATAYILYFYSGSSGGPSLWYTKASNRLTFRMYAPTGTLLNADNAIKYNSDNQVLMVWDGVNNTMELFVNGDMYSRVTGLGAHVGFPGYLYFGGNSSNDSFKGRIGRFMIYEGCPTVKEAKRMYADGMLRGV